ncbi:hypothetical protein ACFSVM_04030 [Paenibacillus shunpengii]|uniref:Lipoprotein n=1 Tax=Paenibacillus shunpengii TaxID=2054424 RepID=A0ABW5SIP8_9BACL
MRQRGITFTLILLLFGVIISGCSLVGEQEQEGLEVRSLMVAFGGGANGTIVSYNFTLWNLSEEPLIHLLNPFCRKQQWSDWKVKTSGLS